MSITLKITPESPKVKVGDSTTFTAAVEGNTDETLTYAWTVDGVKKGSDKNTITVKSDSEGKQEVKVVLTITPTGEEPEVSTIEAKTTITVTEEKIPDPEPETACRYVHPLDHRESAYIWVGYWVMEEIENAVEAGIDWKKPDSTDLKYKCDLKTLAFMLEKYPNIDVQESRNGYILSKDDIEAGVIY